MPNTILQRFIQTVFRDMPDDFRIFAKYAIAIAEKLDTFVHSDDAQAVYDLIPGDIDDHFGAWLKEHLPGILVALKSLEGNRKKLAVASKIFQDYTEVPEGHANFAIEAVFGAGPSIPL